MTNKNMISNFISTKPVLATASAWGGFAAMLLSIINVVSPALGLIGAFFFALIAYHKYKQAKMDTQLKQWTLDSYQKSHNYHLDNPQDKEQSFKIGNE